jgi:uncharacterized protein
LQPTLQRIAAIDVLRGIALLGILLLNILAFGLPAAAYSNPNVDGATSGLNLFTYQFSWLFVEGAMRAIFCMLFGAGIILFTQSKATPAPAYYTRTVLLCIFGLIDLFVLLWLGDVLYVYGVAGLLLYPFRNLRPQRLCIIAATLIAFMVAAQTANLASLESEPVPAFVAEMQAGHTPSAAAIANEVNARHLGYSGNFNYIAGDAFVLATTDLLRGSLWETIATMLLGMALFKWGILSGLRSRRFYLILAAVGYSLGLSINAMEIHFAMVTDYALDWTSPYFTPTYQLGRLGTALGHIALVMLWCRSDGARRLQRMLADVGRLALTNYLTQSVLGLVLFTGVGFSLFGELERTSLYLMVPCIWLFQLGFSTWWLKRFHFGPMEWIWRSLTYGKLPPFARDFARE